MPELKLVVSVEIGPMEAAAILKLGIDNGFDDDESLAGAIVAEMIRREVKSYCSEQQMAFGRLNDYDKFRWLAYYLERCQKMGMRCKPPQSGYDPSRVKTDGPVEFGPPNDVAFETRR